MKASLIKLGHTEWPYACDRYCKIHYYWDFDAEAHQSLPNTWNMKSESGWRSQVVWVGPPGYYPKKPNRSEWDQVRMICPHEQMDLTCNTCLRHTFRPVVL
jgi:hypothetical protein